MYYSTECGSKKTGWVFKIGIKEHAVDDGCDLCLICLTVEFDSINNGVSNCVNYILCNGSTGCVYIEGFSKGVIKPFRTRIIECNSKGGALMMRTKLKRILGNSSEVGHDEGSGS